MKAHAFQDTQGKRLGYLIQCPACGNCHAFHTEVANSVGAKWSFNGNVDRPTFSPSMLCRQPKGCIKDGKVLEADYVCHSFVRDGKIQFLSDCTHAMAGQTVELEEWD